MTTAAEHQRLGFEHFKRGEFRLCVAEIERALALAPDDADALKTLGMALFRLGEHAKAVEVGERLIAAHPKDVMAWTSHSLWLMKAGRVKDAEDASAKAKLLTWKKQLKEGPDPAGLAIVDERPPSPPVMPLMPAPPAPRKPD